MKFKKYTEEEQLEMVKQDGYAIQYIHNQSKKVRLEAVKKDGFLIRYIQNPSLEVQLVAVKQDGLALQYIFKPSLEVQLAAVKQSGYALRYVPEFNEEIYQIVKNNAFYDEEVFKEYEKLRPKEIKEHTMEELSEILGYEVKIVKEKSL